MINRRELVRAVAVAATLSALWIGFNANKPIHTDDPFFLYWARVISPLPGDQPVKYFNWLRYEEPMAEETQHASPGWAVSLAGVRHLAGERIQVLHWLQWPFATMLLSGVFLLARILGAPAWASLFVCGSSPFFLVSTSGNLGDIPAMGLGILGLAAWYSVPSLAGRIMAAILIGLAAQMKVSILVLYPLLLLKTEGGINRSRRDWILVFLSLLFAGTYPAVPPNSPNRDFIVGNLAWIFQTTWNPGLLFMKMSYLSAACGTLIVPAFCYAISLFARNDLAKTSDRVKILLLGIFSIPLLSFAGFWKGQTGAGGFWQLDSGAGAHLDVVPPTLNTLGFYLAIALFLGWVLTTYRNRKEGPARWLFAWILFASAGFVGATWFPAVRHLLPVLPALAMLFLMDLKATCGKTTWRIAVILAVAGNLWLGLSLSRNDTAFARFSVDAAVRGGKEAVSRNLPLLTTGSWGLRYYVEREGGRILYSPSEILPQGAVMLIPTLTDRRVLPAALRKRSQVIWKMSCPPSAKWPLMLPAQPIPPTVTLSAWHGGYVWFPFAFNRAPTETITALEIFPLKGGKENRGEK